MRVWVSGAAGKLGTEVCRQLRAEGHEVLEADARGTGATAVDLLDRDAVAASLRGADAIIHCAAIPSPENVAPADLVENNTMSTFNALEEAWNAGIRLAVLASSGSIYGTAWAPDLLTQPYVPVDEDSTLQYVDPYALTKDLLERMGQLYARRGMTVTALRLPLDRDDGGAARAGPSSEPDQEGARMLWGYVHLQDAARACVLALRPASEQRDRSRRWSSRRPTPGPGSRPSSCWTGTHRSPSAGHPFRGRGRLRLLPRGPGASAGFRRSAGAPAEAVDARPVRDATSEGGPPSSSKARSSG